MCRTCVSISVAADWPPPPPGCVRTSAVSAPPRASRVWNLPVGLAVNGVAYNRLEYFETAFFDVDRVRVLRGPQGIVFGKNTSVGLLSVTTNKPTDTSTGYVDIEVGELGAAARRPRWVVLLPLA